MNDAKVTPNPDALQVLSIVMPEITAINMALIAIIKAHPDPKRLRASFDVLMADLQVGSAARGGAVMSDTGMFKLLGDLRDQIPQ
jgi:hypothetical protein